MLNPRPSAVLASGTFDATRIVAQSRAGVRHRLQHKLLVQDMGLYEFGGKARARDSWSTRPLM